MIEYVVHAGQMRKAYKFLIGKPGWDRLQELGIDANGLHEGRRHFY